MNYEYSHIITLEAIKNYLRVDESFTDDDNDIMQMANSAFEYVERQTRHFFKETYNIYHSDKGKIFVYDTPIISVTDLESEDVNKKVFTCYYSDRVLYHANSIEVKVGYTDSNKAPKALIQAVLQIIKVWYYEHERNEVNGLIPDSVEDVIITYRRFTVC